MGDRVAAGDPPAQLGLRLGLATHRNQLLAVPLLPKPQRRRFNLSKPLLPLDQLMPSADQQLRDRRSLLVDGLDALTAPVLVPGAARRRRTPPSSRTFSISQSYSDSRSSRRTSS